MTPSSKVVQLNAQDAVKGRVGTLPPILQTVRRLAQKELQELLQELFNNADDALFEMADRSRNDRDQNLYFDSMRQLRLHRSRILSAFYENFDSLFNGLTSLSDFDSKSDASGVATEDLALLQHDDLEMAVAVSGIVSKVTNQLSLPIAQLTKRIDSLCPRATVTEQRNPLGPHQLASAFVDAISPIGIDIKVRIILLKLFERFVMERLGTCYDVANRTLADAGVLKDLRSAMRQSVPRARPQAPPNDPRAAMPGPSAHTPASVDGIAAEFSVLQELLAHTQTRGPTSRSAAYGAQTAVTGMASGGAPSTAGPVCTTPELIALLQTVQNDFSSEPIDVDQLPQSINLGQLLTMRGATAGAGVGAFGRSDEDTVNLIGMLFDYILNDRNLAIPMKALIGRLQIPMLKVAILDKSFFSMTSHPARQLLNELSSAGIGWSSGAELKRDALYNEVESIVVRVLNHFDDDFQLFEDLVAELRAFVRQDHDKIERIEQRVRETEAGRAKTIAAKQVVQDLINRKASGLRLPAAVGRFIADTWSRVLVFVNLKFGAECAEWTGTVQTLDDLLWCIQPLESPEDIETRERLIPDLLARVGQGTAHVNLPDNETADALELLSSALNEIAEYDRAFVAEAEEIPDLNRSMMSEIVLAAPEPGSNEEDSVLSEPEMIARINRVSEGTWVEFINDGARQRCKLATIVQPGNRYVFVNRRGMKVRELTRMALATEIRNSTMTVLDESQVFDRALEAVIGNLRQMHRQNASQPS